VSPWRSFAANSGLGIDENPVVRELTGYLSAMGEMDASMSTIRPPLAASTLAVGMLSSADGDLIQQQLSEVDRLKDNFASKVSRLFDTHPDTRPALEAASEDWRRCARSRRSRHQSAS
jgi:hypothetical protein